MTRRRAILWTLLLVLLLALLLHVADRARRAPEPPSPPPGSDRVAGAPDGAGPSGEPPGIPAGAGGRAEHPAAGVSVPAEGAADARGGKESGDLPDGYFPDLSGRVVDLVTGEPIDNARVIYGPFPNWTGDDTDADGAFSYERSTEEELREGLRDVQMALRTLDEKDPERERYRLLVQYYEYEIEQRRTPPDPTVPYRIRVTAPGYEPFEVVPDEPVLEVELRPVDRPPLPGRIRGRLEDPDGRPVRGVVTAVLHRGGTEVGWYAVLGDEHGQFVLDGVEPGSWGVSFGGGDAVAVYVPEDSEVPVVLRAKRLPEHSDAPLARREVRVTGLSGKDGRVVVAENYDRPSGTERWRAAVRDGAARFPALFAGEWTLCLLDPLGKPRWAKVEVPKGSGPTAIPFPAQKDGR